MANSYYSNDFKKMTTELVCVSKQSTIKTSKDLNIPRQILNISINPFYN